MKRFSRFLMAAFAAAVMLAAPSCSEDSEDTPVPPSVLPPVTVQGTVSFEGGASSLPVRFNAEAEPVTVRFAASKSWKASVASDATWLTLSSAGGEAGDPEITLSVAENMSGEERDAVVTLTCDKATATLVVSQGSYELVGFEMSEKLADIDGGPVALGEITLVSGTASAKYSGVYWAKEYTEANDLRDDYDQLFFAAPLFSTKGGDIWFSSYYCDCTLYGMQLDAWGGFVLSSNVNTTVDPGKAGIAEQFSAYVSDTAPNVFAAAYDAESAGMAMSADCCWPQIDFTERPRTVRSIALANSTWTYHYFSGNATDSFVVKVVGMLGGEPIGSVECPLVEGGQKVGDWKSIDLRTLGEVDQLVFSVKSSDAYAPFYFCMDNLSLIK